MTMLLAAIGDAKIMPPADGPACMVINTRSRYIRNNASWVIARILNDYESWMHRDVKVRLESMLNERHEYLRAQTKPRTVVPRPEQTGLCISVYEPSKSLRAGEPVRDLIYWSGLPVAIIQLAISAIPIFIGGDWSILMITASGTILALITGSLPRWKHAK